MQLLNESVSSDERERIARLIYSYIVRRTLSGLTSKNLNKVFQSLAQFFAQSVPSVNAVKDYFAARTGDSTRFPSDQELRQGILAQPAYSLAPRTRIKDILWELEMASRSPLAERIVMPEGLWTEHVLPTNWNEDWPFEDGVFVTQWSGAPKAQTRNQLMHTLGNLTLLSSGLNISSGNKSFVEKKLKFDKHTGLFLNKWFAKKSEWTETDIRERGQHLANLAISIWPSI